jgi:hypothetical protein
VRAWPLPARIVADYYGAPARQRTRPWLIGIPVVFLLFLTANGERRTANCTRRDCASRPAWPWR